MIDDLIEVGDRVAIEIPKENREWGYNPCPDGATATVVGFSEITYGRVGNYGIKPGVYENNSWVKLRFDDGKEHTELSSRLDPLDAEEYQKRLTRFRQNQKDNPDSWGKKVFLRELPETPFWEYDFVFVRGKRHQVVSIDYSDLSSKTLVGTKYPAYKVSNSADAGWHTSASEDDMSLIERGLVWKLYHNEPLSFSSIQEEANFYDRVGRTKEIRNPNNNLYKWTKEEVLEAIRSGIVDGFTVSSFLGLTPSIVAKKYNDRAVGERIAKATLEGFA